MKIEQLFRTRYEDHPEVLAAKASDEAIRDKIAECHEKIQQETVKAID